MNSIKNKIDCIPDENMYAICNKIHDKVETKVWCDIKRELLIKIERPIKIQLVDWLYEFSC